MIQSFQFTYCHGHCRLFLERLQQPEKTRRISSSHTFWYLLFIDLIIWNCNNNSCLACVFYLLLVFFYFYSLLHNCTVQESQNNRQTNRFFSLLIRRRSFSLFALRVLHTRQNTTLIFVSSSSRRLFYMFCIRFVVLFYEKIVFLLAFNFSSFSTSSFLVFVFRHFRSIRFVCRKFGRVFNLTMCLWLVNSTRWLVASFESALAHRMRSTFCIVIELRPVDSIEYWHKFFTGKYTNWSHRQANVLPASSRHSHAQRADIWCEFIWLRSDVINVVEWL